METLQRRRRRRWQRREKKAKKAAERNKDKIKLNFINGLQSKVNFIWSLRSIRKKNNENKTTKIPVPNRNLSICHLSNELPIVVEGRAKEKKNHCHQFNGAAFDVFQFFFLVLHSFNLFDHWIRHTLETELLPVVWTPFAAIHRLMMKCQSFDENQSEKEKKKRRQRNEIEK